MSGLQDELDARLAEFRQKAPAEAQAMIDAQIDSLRASGAEERILQVGAKLPDIALPDARGGQVRLRDIGPAVIVFYRGGWCPYCNMTLRAWQRHLPELQAMGASLVAISPQDADNSLSTQEKNELSFPVLSDSKGVAMAAFGTGYGLPEELQALYARFGHGLDAINGPVGWSLPMPATFAADARGTLVMARAEADYRRRVEPAEALAVLSASIGARVA